MSDWKDSRPLSPHLLAWRWHATMAASIVHRMTGVANILGLVLVVSWLFALAGGEDAYHGWTALFASIWVKVILFAFTAGLVFHAVNGIRYFFWDAGRGMEPDVANAISILNFVLALAGALAIWTVALVRT